jgi:hypothetical protein
MTQQYGDEEPTFEGSYAEFKRYLEDGGKIILPKLNAINLQTGEIEIFENVEITGGRALETSFKSEQKLPIDERYASEYYGAGEEVGYDPETGEFVVIERIYSRSLLNVLLTIRNGSKATSPISTAAELLCLPRWLSGRLSRGGRQILDHNRLYGIVREVEKITIVRRTSTGWDSVFDVERE